MFKSGYSDLATLKLQQTAKNNIKNYGIYEWNDKNGRPKGSAMYSGAAGVLARALVEGYYGVENNYDSRVLSPCLGINSGKIALVHPTSGRSISYNYQCDKNRYCLELVVYSSYFNICSFKIKIPKNINEASIVTVNL